MTAPELSWRCFQCGMVLTTEHDARNHFGEKACVSLQHERERLRLATELEEMKSVAEDAIRQVEKTNKTYAAAAIAFAAERSENETLRSACASGWGEPTLINTLRAELAKAKQTLNLVHPAVDGSLSEVAKAKADQIVGLLNETTVLGGRLAQVESELAAFQPYLKDGETPIERLERERHDNDLLLGALAKEKAYVETVVRVEGHRVAARDKEIADLQIERSLADKATAAARADRDRFQRELAITLAALARERSKRCGTCADWRGATCWCDTSRCFGLLAIPSDHGCPEWRRKDGAQ